MRYNAKVEANMDMDLEILDSTLRDGEQGEGLNYFSTDKLAIYKSLLSLDFTFIEAGNPASNVSDAVFFSALKAQKEVGQSIPVAFTCTVKDTENLASDKNIAAPMNAGTEWLSVVGKASEKQVINILKISLEKNLEMIFKTVEYFTKQSKNVIFDCEHFFDGYASSETYAVNVIETAVSAGAKRIVLCDTNGGAFPDVVFSVTAKIVEKFKDMIIGIHCHNDNGMAVANSIMAVKAGARHIQGTLNGYGERCGNANLATIISNLQLLSGYKILDSASLAKLTTVASHIAEISNKTLDPFAPFVGHSAFTHKAGQHIDGILKDNTGYEIIAPETVGNERRIVLSQMSGKKAVENKLKSAFPMLSGNTVLLEKFAAHIKQKESEGFIYEAAEASLIMELHKLENTYSPLFELIGYTVIIEYPAISGVTSTATLRIKVGDHTTINSGQGNGPVNAMDKALRGSLSAFYPFILDTSLVDYKVRVINPEATTGALVRVLITTTNGAKSWSTIGVSSDIIEASWQALRDSLEYAAIIK